MPRVPLTTVVLAVFLLAGPSRLASSDVSLDLGRLKSPSVKKSATYRPLPLAFEPDNGIGFVSRGEGYGLLLGSRGLTMTLAREDQGSADRRARKPRAVDVLRLMFEGSTRGAGLFGLEQQPGRSHYFIGNDPGRWRTNVPQYARVQWRDVYPGIDVVFYGKEHELEYDVVVAPGADPRKVVLRFEGAKKLSLTDEGDLRVTLRHGGEVVQRRPRVYQEVDSRRQEVAGRYVLGDRKVRFELARFDPTLPIVIDPTLSYATMLSGTFSPYFTHPESLSGGVAVDGFGNAYTAGLTFFSDFAGVPKVPFDGEGTTFRGNAFVTKVDASGALVYSVYVGGSINDQGFAVAADEAGNAYVTGITTSDDFPVVNAYQRIKGTDASSDIAFVTKIGPHGDRLEYSTYFGGRNSIYGPGIGVDDEGTGIAVSARGRIYVTGLTSSADFPTRDPAGLGCHLQCHSGGSYDAFVASFDPGAAGDATLVYSTYLGAARDDEGAAITVDATGKVWVAGRTNSTGFPLVNGFASLRGGNDVFVAGLDAGGVLVYSTALGGSGRDEARAIAVAGDSVYVTGLTYSTDFFLRYGSADPDYVPPGPNNIPPGSNNVDGFLATFKPALGGDGSLVYSTYIGGNGADSGGGLAVDGDRNIYIAGSTSSTNFPTFAPAPNPDAFVIKLDSAGFLVYARRLGDDRAQSVTGIAVNDFGDTYVAGNTDSAGFTTRSYGGGTAGVYVSRTCDCDRPAVPASLPVLVEENGWKMIAEVSQRDGLVLRDVELGKRYLAERVSIPYLGLKTIKDGVTFFEASPPQGTALELVPNDVDAPRGASRLVDFKITRPDAFYAPLVIEATYLINKVPVRSCLRVKQRYEFYPPIDEHVYPELACESSVVVPGLGPAFRLINDFTCAKFKPIVRYDFCSLDGETLVSVNIPTRFHFQVEQDPRVVASPMSTHMLIRDRDPLFSTFDVIGPNPLAVETIQVPIVGGESVPGTADNFHQSYGRLGGRGLAEPFPPPGCPECVHMHWRWGRWHEFPPGFPAGHPVIPKGSEQLVTFAILRTEPAEEHPAQGFGSFFQGEPLLNHDSSFWYSPEGHQAADAFLIHGLFFSPNYARVGGAFGAQFADDASPGDTIFTAVDVSALEPLPPGFAAVEGTGVDITTPGSTGSGPIIVGVGVRIDDPEVFARLRVFHREGEAWVDRTILPPDEPAPDFEHRTLYARVWALSPFVVGLASEGPPANQPPMARCRNVERTASASCTASVMVADVDAGSSDPDGDALTLSLAPAGPLGPGTHEVTLTVTDALGAASSCLSIIKVVDETPPQIACPASVTTGSNSGSCVGSVEPGLAPATDNCAGMSVAGARPDGHSLGFPYPLGSTPITWTAVDASGNQVSCVQTVTVTDGEPPAIGAVSVDRPILWPPNHSLSDVIVRYAVTDNCGSEPVCSVAVNSNEPVDGIGDGDTAPDWEIVDPRHVRLRAERSGTGTGRIYTLSVTCRDGHLASTGTTEVAVPKNQR